MKIRFYIGSTKAISGGVKQIYRQVDVLISLGYDAAVITDGGGPSWFDTDTRVVASADEELCEGDYLVLGEQARVIPAIKGASYASLVVYAQNPYGVSNGFGLDILGILAMYRDRVKAVICVSEHSKKVLEWMLKCDVYRVRYSFDREPFVFCENKRNTISYMPRKEGLSLRNAIQILNAKGLIKDKGWECIEIKEMSELQVASIMKKSRIFLSGSCMEGFGMPSAEAMACGCVVVGYTGAAGDEFMLSGDHAFAVHQGDYLGLAMKVAGMMDMSSGILTGIGRRASNWIRCLYSTEREVSSIKDAWERII